VREDFAPGPPGRSFIARPRHQKTTAPQSPPMRSPRAIAVIARRSSSNPAPDRHPPYSDRRVNLAHLFHGQPTEKVKTLAVTAQRANNHT